MTTLKEITHIIASKGGKDEDDAFLNMLEPIIHQVRLKLIKQHIDKRGVLPWMLQTIRLPLEKSCNCMTYYEELISTCKLPRVIRNNDGVFVRNIYLPDGTPLLITQEMDDLIYNNLKPEPIRAFLRNDRVIVRGNLRLKEVRVEDIFENPLQTIGLCCDELSDYPLHDDLVSTLIEMVNKIVYNDADLPRDMAELQRIAGISSSN